MSPTTTAPKALSVSAVHPAQGPIRRLIALFSAERRDIALVILFSVAVGILTLATPITVQALVNFVSFGGYLQPLVILAILLFGFLAMAGAIRTLQTYIIEILQRRLFVRVVADLSDRLPRVRAECYDRQNGPELVNRFFDIVTVQKVAAMLLLDGATVLLQALVGLLILAFYHPFLLAFDATLILAVGFVVVVLGRGAIPTAINESKAKYAVAAALEEMARHPLVFKLAGAADFGRHRADLLTVEYVRSRQRHFAIVLRQIIGFISLQVLAATALLTLGGWLVLEGQLTLGQLVAAELIVSGVLASLFKFGKQFESVYDLLAAVDKLGHLMDLPLERDEGRHHTAQSPGMALEMRQVSFTFDGHKPVLDGLNLSVASGERVCIVGGHGTGKSVLTELAIGLRAPSAGRISLDGVDLREMSLKSIREHVAVVQGVGTIEGSLEENIRMGREDVTHAEIRSALADVGLLDEIRDMPDGLSMSLTTSGSPLSAGQAMRLMIARALVGRPRVLILDDVLDDLDNEARDAVLTAILDPNRQWTVIILGRRTLAHKGLGRNIHLRDAGGDSVAMKPAPAIGARS